MTGITPSDTQARAIAAIKDWFGNRPGEQQVFRLFGYAGTGKSTVLKFALDELGLDPHRNDKDGGACVPGVVTATFTGKAALVLRRKGTPYDELGLDDPKWTDDQLIDFMVAHPILVNRPIVCTPRGVRLCRPSETVLDLLDRMPPGPFHKEDGELLIDVEGRRVG